jgi:hypothetical protein
VKTQHFHLSHEHGLYSFLINPIPETFVSNCHLFRKDSQRVSRLFELWHILRTESINEYILLLVLKDLWIVLEEGSGIGVYPSAADTIPVLDYLINSDNLLENFIVIVNLLEEQEFTKLL